MEKILTILIVDDETLDRAILRNIFETDYNILEACNGEEAMTILRSEKEKDKKVDIILLDIMMPVMDGWEFMAALRAEEKLRDITVIVSSQYGEPENEIRALEMGADDFIHKPYNNRVVRQRVTNVAKRLVYERYEKKEAQEQMSHQNHRDLLTGLYNREAFYRKSKEFILAHADKDCVICMLDVDRFKVVNELFGTIQGDRVLCDLSRLLRGMIRQNGICARAEADKFIICTTKDYLDSIMPQLEVVLTGHEEWGSIDYTMQLHMGIYIVEDPQMAVSLMCDRADIAKQIIKGSYVKRWNYYDEEMTDALLNEQEFTNEMEIALDDGQFMVFLQPIVDTRTGKTISAEALIRWNHPTKGMISPGVFIPLFEKNGFIALLDLYVCEQVCRFQEEQKEKGNPLVPISVNISRINFYKPEFGRQIMNIMEKYHVDPAVIKLEITEGAYENNPKYMMDAIRGFQERRVKILMDDFGSGYSSLNMLKDFNVDILKIDMKFISDLGTSDQADNILFAILQMAKALNMETVAEGVETQEQYDLLVSMGCDSIQGYYFSKPITPEDFRERLSGEQGKHFSKRWATEDQTILIVDDQKTDREIIRNMIGDGRNIIEASNGEEALEVLKLHFKDISLVISDIHMPKMTGLELLQHMQALIFLKDIPTIIVTAFGERESEEKALNLGALDIINKPYDATLVRKRIENILRISETESLLRRIEGRSKRLAAQSESGQ